MHREHPRWAGKSYVPHESQRLPMSRGSSDGQVNTPSATGTCIVLTYRAINFGREGTAVADDLQRLLDERAIRRILLDYCRGIDRCDRDLIAGVYHPDATDDHGGYVGTGVGFADYVVERLTGDYDATLHFLGDSCIDFVDDDTAEVETYVLAQHRRDDPATIVHFGGRYLDRMERRNGEWKIAERLVVREWDKTESVELAWPAHRFAEGGRLPEPSVVDRRGDPEI